MKTMYSYCDSAGEPANFFQASPAPRANKNAAPGGSGSFLFVNFGEILFPHKLLI